MLLSIPNYEDIVIENLVFDMNGTIAENGIITNAVKDMLLKLSKTFSVYIITADTFGSIKNYFKNTNIHIKILETSNGTLEKKDFILKIGKDKTIAIGNGANDLEMIKTAKIGICILNSEGAYTKTLINSDIIFKNFNDLYNSLINTKRLIATIRK